MSAQAPHPSTIVRKKQAMEYIPLASTQWRWHEKHDPAFPKAIKLSTSGRATGYLLSEILAYQAKLIERRNEKLRAGGAK